MVRLALILLFAGAVAGQQQRGELRLDVTDPTGAPLSATVTITGQATEVRQRAVTSAAGQLALPLLPFGAYQVVVEHPDFAPATLLVEIRSAVPEVRRVTLGVAPVETTMQVTESDTLLNPSRTGSTQQIGEETIRDRRGGPPARAILNLVDTQPGWLLEANGVLHPRGAEYGVQYVVDGLPLFDNRSPAFAPMLDIGEVQSLTVRTGGYPAEYGRKLGGVIEVTTARDTRPGLHGKAELEGGSFATAGGSAALQYTRGRDTFEVSGDAGATDRYLDPPVEENFSNHGSGGGGGGHWERDWGASDRTRIAVSHNRTGFLVPNERLQQDAGQRQDRTSGETSGTLAWTHLLSPRLLLDVRGMGRDTTAAFWSNALSTPIAPAQQRGFREGYASASLSAHLGAHDLKFGGDAAVRSIGEDFSYRITAYRVGGVRIFDRDTPAVFAFADRRQNLEQSAYVQDQVRWRSLTLSAGVRWDHYRLMVDEQAASPRLSASWQVPGAGLVLRAAYDRAFQTPAVENLLLASSPALLALNNAGLTLAVRPSRGNYYEAGAAKSLWSRARLDATWFRRSLRNFADDDVLLNTGVSFPIAFDRAGIQGVEVKLEIPRWGPLSGFASYTNFAGRGYFPVTGGLFLDDNAGALLASHDVFPITQDQRNTARARFRVQAAPRLWMAAAAQYGSGLPVELDSPDLALLQQQYGADVLARVNLDRGRVRPSFSADFSVGAALWSHEGRALRVQVDVFNLTGRLNVINFAGLFSGTALAPRRSASARVEWEF